MGELNWRAVVPLHNIGIPADQIEEMVNLGIGNFDKLTGFGIESVANIIAYYEEVKAHYDQTLIPAQMADLYNIETPLRTIEHIATLLEQGRFTPPKDAPFHRASDWQHPAFQITDGSRK